MDEREWLACTSPRKLLDFLRGRASDRRLRLFACAVSRRRSGRLDEEVFRRAVEVAEEAADGRAARGRLSRAYTAARSAFSWSSPGKIARWIATSAAVSEASYAAQAAAGFGPTTGLRLAGVAAVLREVFNPFHAVIGEPSWRTTTVLALAQVAYDHRILPSGQLDPERLAVLADALEESGCDDADLLGHLRSNGVHSRGCWAVDCVLGKE